MGKIFLSSPKRPDRPAQRPIQWVWVFFPGGRAVWRNVNHSPASSAEVRMSGAVPLFHLHAFMEWTWKTLPNIFCPSHCTLSTKEFVDERFETTRWFKYDRD